MTCETVFYIVGTIFFLIVIIVAIIFAKNVWSTSRLIKKVLTSTQIEDILMQVKVGLGPLLRSLGIA